MAAKPPVEEKSKAPLDGIPKITSPLSPYRFHLIMALVAVVILVGGYVFYYFQEQQMRQRIEGGLSIMAQLKVEQIVDWRAGRLVDANVLVGSPFFTEGVAKYMASPTDTEAKDKVLAKLAVIDEAYPYQDILLTDVNGKVLLSLNDSVNRLSDMTLAQLAVAIKEHKAVITDFHYVPDGDFAHLDVVTPLFPWGQDSPQAIGAVVFCIDPSQYLYPLLQSSPMPSQTAETLLVERDGNQVLFLNELRHQKDTALKLRIPLSQQEVPAVMAVLGQEGVVEGKDYRGVEVLAALKHIPDSPWYIVAKIDTSEALASWRPRAGMIIAFFAGLLIAALAGIGFIWQRRQRLAYQALYQAELETQALRSHFEYLVKYANDIIFLVDGTQHIVEVNDRALETYGYTRQEMLGMPLVALIPPGNLPSYQARLRKIQQKGKIVAEAIHQRKDGSTFPVEVSARSIKIEGNLYLQAIIRDITERKRTEHEKSIILATMPDLLAYQDLEHRVVLANRAAGESVGLAPEDLVGRYCYEIWQQRSLPCVNCPVERAWETGKPEEDEVGSPDGRSWLIRGYPVTGPDGVVRGAIEITQDITERKRAEEELRGSEEKYRDLVETIPDVIFSVDENGIITYLSPSVETMTGYSVPELMGRTFADFLHPEDLVYAFESFQRSLSGQTIIGESRFFTKSGETRWLRNSNKPIFVGDRVVGVRGIFSDVTEHKRAEEALRAGEERFRIAAASASDLIWDWDIPSGRLDWYGKIDEILGYGKGEFPRTIDAWGKEIHADDISRVNATLDSHFKEGTPYDEEYRIKRKDGAYLYWEDRGVALRDDKGQPYRMVGACSDVTERKQAEETLRQSEERYRTILEEMEESYYEVDIAGNFTFVNDALCRRLGHSREELMGVNYRTYTPEESTDATYKIFNQVYRTGQLVKGFPAVAVTRDGSLLFTERSVFPLRDAKGNIIGFRGISHDVTERKMAEEQRRQLELKAQITSRLASVGEMAAGVAHEINNPLTAVTGYAQLLVDREDVPPDIRRDLAAINDGAQRVAGIVRRLLTFSRQTKPERKLVDINELIESTLVLRAYHLRVNNIEVVTRLASDLLETVADPGQIQQVLLNLIVNAETEMKLAHGKGKLTITTEKSNNTIKICVKDNGPGIKPEDTDRIFDPFFTTREVGQGTGLGLSLCYGIVTEHKGKIYAESQSGKGATFIVELPVVTEVAPLKPAEPVVKKSKKAARASILVVDDEQVVRGVVNRVLSGEGHKVETVDNAADALKKVESQKYDLILVDIKMPGMSGVELYKRIRKIDKSLARKVVFITGDVMGAGTEKFLSKTKVAHIEKPFDSKQLSRGVNQALNKG